MHLIIGGYAQGKLVYARQKYNVSDDEICDGAVEDFEICKGRRIYNHLHLYLRRKMEQTDDLSGLMEQFLRENPSCILICDEVGNGIVPVAETERTYRETVGRMLCLAAERSESVERILCGISQKIK